VVLECPQEQVALLHLDSGKEAEHMAEAQDLQNLLLETNEEYRQLASRHHELDDRLHELTTKHYLSDAEQVEEINLKKRKLLLKDRMELILREYRAGTSRTAINA